MTDPLSHPPIPADNTAVFTGLSSDGISLVYSHWFTATGLQPLVYSHWFTAALQSSLESRAAESGCWIISEV